MLKYSERKVWSGQNKAEMASVSTRECVKAHGPLLVLHTTERSGEGCD